MANNYVQFSESIADITEEEQAWIKEELVSPSDRDPAVYPEDEGAADAYMEAWSKERPNVDDAETWPDFGWSFIEDDEDASKELWIHADESGDLNHIAVFVQRLLRKFRPNEVFTLTWAETCSSPRIGEFGGGWMVVTAKGERSENAWGAVEAAAKELEAELR